MEELHNVEVKVVGRVIGDKVNIPLSYKSRSDSYTIYRRFGIDSVLKINKHGGTELESEEYKRIKEELESEWSNVLMRPSDHAKLSEAGMYTLMEDGGSRTGVEAPLLELVGTLYFEHDTYHHLYVDDVRILRKNPQLTHEV